MKILTINGSTLLLLLLSLAVLSMIFVFLFRKYLASRSKNQSIDNERNLIRYRTKYPAKDVNQFSGIFFKLGLLIAITLVVFAFSWTSFEKPDLKATDTDYTDDLIIEQIPNTYQQPKPKLKIPKVIIELPDEQIIDEEPELESMDVFEESEVYSEPEEIEEQIVEAPKLPLPVQEEEEELPFPIVEDNPRFPGCEHLELSNKEKEACSKKALLDYIYSNLKYPAIARENGVEGMVVIQFVVGKDGTISKVQIKRDIGAGCGDAAAKVVDSMNEMDEKWRPGKQRGRAVPVLFTLPVKFKLQ